MRASGWVLLVVVFAGCQRPAPPRSASHVVEPADFANWPRITERPVQVGPELWADCRGPTPEETAARNAAATRHGPHVEYAIVVRVSPGAIAAFRQGRQLPVGAVVVKEKYMDRLASGPMQAYAVMVKREAGYDPGGGDWEYAYVRLAPEREVSRGRLAECAGCHASARDRDYLFRSYGGPGQ